MMSIDAAARAGALGNVIGGALGATAALAVVYLTLSRQRSEDAAKIGRSIDAEIAMLVKFVIGALDVCSDIHSQSRQVPQVDATYVSKTLHKPIVFPAVADRLSMLAQPQAVINFYMRIEEAKAMLSAIQDRAESRQLQNIYLSPKDIEPVADSLITALQLAAGILETNIGPETAMSQKIRDASVQQVREALKSAHAIWPTVQSFSTEITAS